LFIADCALFAMDTIVTVLPELDEDAVLPPRPTRVFRPTHMYVLANAASQASVLCKNCGDLANRLHMEQVKAAEMAANLKEQVKVMQSQRDANGKTSEEQRHEINAITGELIKVSRQLDQMEKERDAALVASAAMQQKLDSDFARLASVSAFAITQQLQDASDTPIVLEPAFMQSSQQPPAELVEPCVLDDLDLALLPTSTTTTDLFIVAPDAGISLLDTLQLVDEDAAAALFDTISPAGGNDTADFVDATPMPGTLNNFTDFAPSSLCEDGAEFDIAPCTIEQCAPLALSATGDATDEAFQAADVFFPADVEAPVDMSPFTNVDDSSSTNSKEQELTVPAATNEIQVHSGNSNDADVNAAVDEKSLSAASPQPEIEARAPSTTVGEHPVSKTTRQAAAAATKTVASTSAIAIAATEVLTHTEAALTKMTMHELKHFCDRLGIRYVAPKATTVRALLTAATKIASTPSAARS
jgi:hypothetical protein